LPTRSAAKARASRRATRTQPFDPERHQDPDPAAAETIAAAPQESAEAVREAISSWMERPTRSTPRQYRRSSQVASDAQVQCALAAAEAAAAAAAAKAEAKPARGRKAKEEKKRRPRQGRAGQEAKK